MAQRFGPQRLKGLDVLGATPEALPKVAGQRLTTSWHVDIGVVVRAAICDDITPFEYKLGILSTETYVIWMSTGTKRLT